LLTFLLYSFRRLPLLLSFPTRRSSDLSNSVLSAFPKKILFAQFEIIVSLYFISGAFPSSCDKFCAVIVVATLYFLYKVNIASVRSEEHTSELQSRFDLVCRLLLEKKKL